MLAEAAGKPLYASNSYAIDFPRFAIKHENAGVSKDSLHLLLPARFIFMIVELVSSLANKRASSGRP
jgi:hypothetical protein